MVSIGRIIGFLGKKVSKAEQVSQAILPKTQCYTNDAGEVVKMTRKMRDKQGNDITAVWEKLGDGNSKMSILNNNNFAYIWSNKKITREPNASIMGGNRINIEKDYTVHWSYNKKTQLTKDYSSNGVLEHKNLIFDKNSGNEVFTHHNATQDRLYNEVPLSSSYEDMLKAPSDSQNILHSLDGRNNYYKFGVDESKYSKAVAAKEQTIIDAAKKAEAEAIAAKEAAEKATIELKAKQPKANVAKILNRDINDLVINEIKLANGAVERTFTDPETGKILVKTKTHGLKQEEWYYGGKADEVYVKLLGENDKYILAKKGNYKYSYSSELKNGYGTENSFVYYDDGINSLKYQFDPYTKKVGNADGCIKLIDSNNETKEVLIRNGSLVHKDNYDYLCSYFKHEIEANPDLKKVNETLNYFNKETQKNSIDLKDLIRGYQS